MTRRPSGALTLALSLWLAAGCTGLLPRSTEVAGPWTSYREAQEAFDLIVPGTTTTEELRALDIDPERTPNIAILNYSDVLRRFMLNQSVTLSDLDHGVQQCVMAKTECRGLEINQRRVRRQRDGSFWLDLFAFKRETHVQGWRFNGLLLIKDDVVIYKLSGGQPAIHETEESRNPLGPVQSIGSKLSGGWL